MMTYGEVDKLRWIRDPDGSVLSLYLDVPLNPAGLRELPAHASALISRAAEMGPGSLNAEDERVVRGVLAARGRQWLGRTVAIFTCVDQGLLEVEMLPGSFGERAVLGVRAHVRPLLANLQRHPDHRVVIINGRHVWLLSVSAEGIETVAKTSGDIGPGKGYAGYAGWYELGAYNAERRMAELAHHYYEEAAAILARTAHYAGDQPLVVGGHLEGIKHLLAELPAEVRNCYAGCFAADAHTLTPARARELAAPVVAQWAERHEHQQLADVIGSNGTVRAAIGLHASLAAVNADEVDVLLIPDKLMVPGFHCERCGVFSMTGDDCCDWGTASLAVPDLLEEMALLTMDREAEVVSVRELPFRAAAKLRRPS